MPELVSQQQRLDADKSKKKTADELGLKIQAQEEFELSSTLWNRFDEFRRNRDRGFMYFRGRDLVSYINDSNKRFNNLKSKPAWKADWQANTSDITSHAKLMSIVAQVVVNRMKPEFAARFQGDFFADIKAGVYRDIHEFTDTKMRNGELDLLFTLMRAAREGTVLGFEGWKKGVDGEQIDAQFIPLEDFYPDNVNVFAMDDVYRAFWRTKMPLSVFRDRYKNWHNAELVPDVGIINQLNEPLFKVSQDVLVGEVEVIRYLDRLDDEFHIWANGVMMTEKGSKLSSRRKDKKLGVWKGVYEPYGDDFFYGRSLMDIMSDDQDAIDFLFNAMFDKEILSIMRPLLVGGMNDLSEDYFYPGSVKKINGDVGQIKELQYEGVSINAFRLLKELKDRQHFASTDSISSGVSIGGRTATEVERAQEAARKIFAMFSLLIKDAMIQKTRLRVSTIRQFMIGSSVYKEFVLENAMLTEKKYGTKIVRFKDKKGLSKADLFRFSPLLAQENALISGDSEIIEIDPKELKDFELDVKIGAASSVEMSESLKRAFIDRWTTKAYQLPQVFDPRVVGRIDVEANRDFLGHMADNLVAVGNIPGQGGELTAGELGNELLPTAKAAVPKLKSLINNPV